MPSISIAVTPQDAITELRQMLHAQQRRTARWVGLTPPTMTPEDRARHLARLKCCELMLTEVVGTNSLVSRPRTIEVPS